MLESGKIIDRYGYPGGTYTSSVVTPYSIRALPLAPIIKIILFMNFSNP
ncbi:glycohydrolase toxin TNT-related protein [Pantoea stewartii]